MKNGPVVEKRQCIYPIEYFTGIKHKNKSTITESCSKYIFRLKIAGWHYHATLGGKNDLKQMHMSYFCRKKQWKEKPKTNKSNYRVG